MAALAVFWWVQTEPEPKPRQEVVHGFLPLNPEDLVEISFFQPQSEMLVRLARDEEEWRLVEPIRDLADPAWIQALLQALALDPWFPAPPEWEAFEDSDLGLARPEVLAEFRDHTGAEVQVRVGVAELGGDRHAVSVNGTRMRLGRGTLDFFRRSFHSWREMRVIEKPGSWDRLTWDNGQGESRVFVRREGRWAIQHPFAGPLSRQGIRSLHRLLRLRTDELTEDTVTPEQRTKIEAGERWLFENRRDFFVLHRIGGTVLAGDRPYPLYVSTQDFALATLSQKEMIGRYLFEEPPAEMVSLRISWLGEDVDFRRRASAWVGASPSAPATVPSHLLDQLVERLCHFEIDQSRPQPSGNPLATVILSRSRTPLARSGLEISLWSTPTGEILVGDPAAGGWNADPPLAGLLLRILKK